MTPIAATMLADEVYRRVREEVIEGRLPPGSPIDRRDLAAALGVSATPVNAALARLAGERFLERRSGPGGAEAYSVPAMSPEDLAGIFAARAGLEGIAARLCVERAIEDPAAAVELEGICSLFEAFSLPLDAAGMRDYLDADKRFHEGLMLTAGNRILLDIDGNLGCVHRSWARGLVRPPEETLGEHLALASAFRARDAGRAQTLAMEHNLRTRDRLLGRA